VDTAQLTVFRRQSLKVHGSHVTIDLQQTAVNAVPSIVAAVLSAGLTARWALTRFRTEKWWEKKVQTYTEIAQALFLVKRYVDDWLTNYDARAERTEDYMTRLLDDWHKGARAVDEATVIGTFVISEEATAVLETLRRDKVQGDPDDAFDEASHEAAALEKAIPAFIAAARADLGIESRPSISSRLRQSDALRPARALR
jgi:hypothetical protein